MIEERYSGKDQRERGDENRQREGSESGERGGFWNEPRSDDESSRSELEARRDPDEDRYYRGYYSRSRTPFRTARGGYGDLLLESWTLTGPYTGRGPKGYRRSDEHILEEACRRLEQDGSIDAREIEVSCENGVVRLQGQVENRRVKRLAEDCVESVYGVRDVMNELRVRSESSRDDGETSGRQDGGQSARGSSSAMPGRESGEMSGKGGGSGFGPQPGRAEGSTSAREGGRSSQGRKSKSGRSA